MRNEVLKSVLILVCWSGQLGRGEPSLYPHQLEGRYVGVLGNGKCMKEVKTTDLHLVGRSSGTTQQDGVVVIDACCFGYTPNVTNPQQCIAVCESGCPGGVCIAPDVCGCHSDDVLNMKDQCVPTCPRGCDNGICRGNKQCVCNRGYKPSSSRMYCQAHCKTECGPHGYCDTPNHCKCRKGYMRFNATCVPECIPPCNNGVCWGNNKCKCNPGFVKVNDKCVRRCPNGCSNGTCNQFGACICHQGWILNEERNACRPLCNPECVNGKCVAPNKCLCLQGHENIAGRCVPQELT